MAKRLHTYHEILVLSLLICITTANPDFQSLQARWKPEFDSYFDISEAIADLISDSLIQCLAECFTKVKCLTFFYNSDTGRCVMHSRDFVYQVPYVTDTGWKFYITEDVSGRCPPTNYYYRHLEFCYTVEQVASGDFSDVKAVCNNKGSRLATITNQEYQDYFNHVLEGRPVIFVCLAGTVKADSSIEFDDGSVFTYYNWNPSQPDSPGSEACLLMKIGNHWHDSSCFGYRNCVFVCEIN